MRGRLAGKEGFSDKALQLAIGTFQSTVSHIRGQLLHKFPTNAQIIDRRSVPLLRIPSPRSHFSSLSMVSQTMMRFALRTDK